MRDNRHLKVPCMGMGKILGHRFRARYSTESAWPSGGNLEVTNVPPSVAVTLLKNQKSTYEGDVCERCGLVVNRS